MRKVVTQKKLLLIALLITAVSAGALMLRSQQQNQTRERKPPRPGTIPALIEKSQDDEIRLGVEIDYPTFGSLDALADSSDAVIRGKVVGSRSLMCNRMEFVCTQFRVKVLELLWGSILDNRRGSDEIPSFRPGVDHHSQRPGPGPDEIVVTLPGGSIVVNGKRVRAGVADQKELKNGQEYVLFLTWISESRHTTLGNNTYALMGGPQGGVEIQGDQIQSMAPAYHHDHPIRFEVESLLKGHLGLLTSHFEERRLGRRP